MVASHYQSFKLLSWLLEIYHFCKIWLEAFRKNCFQLRLIFYETPVSWVKGDLWQGPFYIFLWIPTCFEASFEVCKALFKCCFWRVCLKQSYCFAFDKTSFCPGRLARAKMGILKGFCRLVVNFDVQDRFFYVFLSFEHHCIQKGYFVLWYFSRELRVECVSLFFNEMIHFISFTVPEREIVISRDLKIKVWQSYHKRQATVCG